MIDKWIKKTQFFSENSEDENIAYFDRKQKKYLHNIDTLYYTIMVKGETDKSNEEKLDKLISDLKILKEKVLETKKHEPYKFGLLFMYGRFEFYEFRIHEADKYDIFIASTLPNSDTPRIVVQIRSSSLWLDGVDDSINESCKMVENILNDYELEIEPARENRIDYAYHTNVIQDPYHHFSDKILEKKMKTSMKTYQKRGIIGKNNLSLEYLALGNRQSNNVFIRIYNKGREVVEEGYKQFFFKIWYENGLINFYDQWCYEQCYKTNNYDIMDKARLQFYLFYGKDQVHKNEISLVLSDKNTKSEEIKQLADSLMPQVTVIMNIEFQTKRKFYYSLDSYIEQFLEPKSEYLLSDDYNSKTNRLMSIVHNRIQFLKYLTEETLKFVDEKGNTLNWWLRLQCLQIDSLNIDKEACREYNYNLDYSKIIKKMINTVATSGIYRNKKDSNFMEDLSDVLCSLNDNYMKDKKIGEYSDYKEKKHDTIKNRLPKMVTEKE